MSGGVNQGGPVGHTPGPWHYDRDVGNDGDYIRESGSDACVAMLIDGGHCDPLEAMLQDEIDANARLIAAAPDLLEALEWLALFADVRSKDDSKTFARVNRGALRTIRDKATAAIARAKGEA